MIIHEEMDEKVSDGTLWYPLNRQENVEDITKTQYMKRADQPFLIFGPRDSRISNHGRSRFTSTPHWKN
jgi:hypothetical protein